MQQVALDKKSNMEYLEKEVGLKRFLPRAIIESLKVGILKVRTLYLCFYPLLCLVTSTLTAYLTPNTRPSTPRLKYHIPKINTHQLSSLVELCYCCCYLI